MNLPMITLAMAAGAAAAQLAAPLLAQTGTTRPNPAPVAAAVVDDARRAAAQRLLDASRFRARQSVLLDDSIRASRADLQADCLDRAESGRSLAGCDATGRPDTARLNAARPAMLDEILVASQTVYARRFTAPEMDEITRFFKTPVGQKYGALYPQVISEVQDRKRTIVRKYLIAAAGPARTR